MTILRTIHLIKTDYEANRTFFKLKSRVFLKVFTHPGFFAIFLYRIAHYFYANNFRMISRLIYILNIWFTSAEISPSCEIGESFLMLHPVAMNISGKIGNHVTFTAQNGMGGDGSNIDIG